MQQKMHLYDSHEKYYEGDAKRACHIDQYAFGIFKTAVPLPSPPCQIRPLQ